MESKLILCLLIFLTNGVFGAGTDDIKTEEVMTAVGQSVTLHSGVRDYHQINWRLVPQNRNIAKCRRNTDGTGSCEITDESLRDRLETDSQSGSLTIINISTELSGLYELQIIDNSPKKESSHTFNVTVSEAGQEPDHKLKWALGLLVLLVLVAVA